MHIFAVPDGVVLARLSVSACLCILIHIESSSIRNEFIKATLKKIYCNCLRACYFCITKTLVETKKTS